jgi:hypothetical protein
VEIDKKIDEPGAHRGSFGATALNYLEHPEFKSTSYVYFLIHLRKSV